MKRKLLILTLLICALCSLVLSVGFLVIPNEQYTAYATETNDIDPEQGELGADIDAETETKTTNYTFLGRVWEWLQAKKVEVIAITTDAITVGGLIFAYIKSKKKLLNIDNVTSFTNSTQSKIVGVVNELVGNYNLIEKKISDYEDKESERYKNVVAMCIQTKAVLDILTTVYANSKNLPQGVKDLVNLKYADALKIIGGKKKEDFDLNSESKNEIEKAEE